MALTWVRKLLVKLDSKWAGDRPESKPFQFGFWKLDGLFVGIVLKSAEKPLRFSELVALFWMIL